MTTEAFDLRKLKRKLWKRYSLSKADRDYYYTAFKGTSNKLRSKLVASTFTSRLLEALPKI